MPGPGIADRPRDKRTFRRTADFTPAAFSQGLQSCQGNSRKTFVTFFQRSIYYICISHALRNRSLISNRVEIAHACVVGPVVVDPSS